MSTQNSQYIKYWLRRPDTDANNSSIPSSLSFYACDDGRIEVTTFNGCWTHEIDRTQYLTRSEARAIYAKYLRKNYVASTYTN